MKSFVELAFMIMIATFHKLRSVGEIYNVRVSFSGRGSGFWFGFGAEPRGSRSSTCTAVVIAPSVRRETMPHSALFAGSVTHPTDCAPMIAQCSSSSAEAPDTPMAPNTLFEWSRQSTPPGTAQNGRLLFPPSVVIARS